MRKFMAKYVVIAVVFGMMLQLSASSAVSGEELRHKYFMLAETGFKPMCTVEMLINDEHVAKIEPNVKEEILEVTKYMKPGNNNVTFEASVIPGEGNDDGDIHVHIGEGAFEDGKLRWEGLKIHYQVSRRIMKVKNKDVLTETHTLAAD